MMGPPGLKDSGEGSEEVEMAVEKVLRVAFMIGPPGIMLVMGDAVVMGLKGVMVGGEEVALMMGPPGL